MHNTELVFVNYFVNKIRNMKGCGCNFVVECYGSVYCWRAGSQVLALLMLFLCVIFHTMWSGKSMQLLRILPFAMLCLSAISMMFVKILLAVCMLVGILA